VTLVSAEPVQIRAHGRSVKRPGAWTTARRYEVRASRSLDHDDLRRVGRGRVKDWTGTPAPDGRRIKLVGELRNAEVRIHRGGVAILSLLLSRRHRDEGRPGGLRPLV
jgi:hypothetical protein